MIVTADTQRCTHSEWEEFRRMVADGMLFEVVEWLDQGKPTLRPENKHTSAFESALLAPNLSMTQVLWERAWQERAEAVRAFSSLAMHRTSDVVMRYLLENGCPVDHVTGYDLCLFHDHELVRLGIDRGVSLVGPDGWASAFIHVGSRPLIRIYLEQKDKIPELKHDAVRALSGCIAESRLRATALLLWAGVDPLGKAPRYDDSDDPVDEWDSFPALRVARAEKAGELLKLLKLKPSSEQWFELLEETLTARVDHLQEIMALRKDPDAVVREHPERASALLRSLLLHLCWGWSWLPTRDERITNFCIHLLEQGVQLCWENMDAVARIRREIYRTAQKSNVAKVLSCAAARAQDPSRIQMAELVRVPKMREWVIQNDPMILRHLGIPGPADFMAPSGSSRRRQPSVPVKTSPQPAKSIKPSETPPPQCAIKPRNCEQSKPIAGHLIKHHGGRVLHREEIYHDVWAEATMHVARRYGISGSMLARICTHLQIPRPPRGYRARPKKARKGMKPRLPPWRSDQEDWWAINPINVKAQNRKST
jgi:hypothetical protein